MPRAHKFSIDQVAYAAVAVFVLVITWNGFRTPVGAIGSFFLAVAFVAVLGQTLLARRPLPLPPWMVAAALGFTVAAMLNIIFPPDQALLDRTLLYFRSLPGRNLGYLIPRPDLVQLIQFVIALLVVPMMIAAVATTRARVRGLLDLFVIGATVNAFVGIVDLAGLPIAPYQIAGSRTAALTIHPNYLALACTIAAPLALLWVTRGGRWRTAGYASAGLLLLGAYASGSRVGAVTAALAVVATFVLLPGLRRGLGVVVPVVGIGVVTVVLVAGDQILEQVRLGGDLGTTVNTAASDLQRSKTSSLALDQFQARPLQGVGYSVIADAHIIYLQLLASGGLIAMAAFITYIGGLAGSLRRALAGPQRDAAVVCGLAILMWLINGTHDNQLADKYLYVIPGFIVAMARLATLEAAADERRGRGATPSPAIAPQPQPAGAPQLPAGAGRAGLSYS
jgi:hypothetical protein